MLAALALVAPLGESLAQRPLLAAVTLFGAGLVTSLTPCVYPMIPITASLLAGAGDGPGATRGRVVRLTVTYITGLALFYALLGLIAGLTGSLFGTVASSPWARGAIVLLLIAFGLAMLDVVPVPVPAGLARWAGALRGGSYPAAFLLGATSGIVAAPCGAPAFGVVLTWVATTGSPGMGFLYLFVFSLGMTALLAAVGIFSGTLARLPSGGPWMAWIKKGAGMVMLGVAGYYAYLLLESIR